MKHVIAGLFPQPITKLECNVEGICDFFDAAVKNNGEVVAANFYFGGGSSRLLHYHNDSNVFGIYPELKNLHDEILEKSNFVYQKILNHESDLFITNAWFNECQVGGNQKPHNHTNSVLSGTVYLRTDENTSVNFYSPYGYANTCNTLTNDPTDAPNEYGYNFHHKTVTLNVNSGDCLFWESFMKHGYKDNKTPNRLSLSFNLMSNTFRNLYKPHEI